MSRYIDVEEVTRAIFKRAVESTMDLNTVGDIINIIRDFPTADVVEVVRCKDCEDWQDDWIPSCGDNGSHYCSTMDSVMKPTDYCSYGERREDDKGRNTTSI